MKIAIVKLSALGDIVHAMTVLQFIKLDNQQIQIDWIVQEEFVQLLESNPDINQVHTVNLKKAKKMKSFSMFFIELLKLKKLGPYDTVIDMQGLIKSALIAKIIPSRVTIGFDKFSSREAISAMFYNALYNISYRENVILRNIQLANFALGIDITKEQVEQKKPYLFSEKIFNLPDVGNTKKNILLVTRASFKAKIYPARKYIQLIKKIDANFLLLWGNDDEKKSVNDIAHKADNVFILEKLDLISLISIISQVDLVIGSDTGPTHMAWALNIPSITLFGATPGYRNSFQTSHNQIIESESKVNPYKINKTDFSIREIRVDDIVKMTRKLLKGIE